MTLRELPKEALERGAVVYVRQSTGTQVQENLESQRRQYGLVDLARSYGFRDVAVIDADLGRSASGTMDRPGFRDLVGRICEGAVGAVFCLEASRLARNGRDWHHLLELCGLVGAFVIDSDGVHDPGVPNVSRMTFALDRAGKVHRAAPRGTRPSAARPPLHPPPTRSSCG
jgi:DNA invertase Pin-like site-specific DNA recombinase